jgi:hypothetical protein
MPMVRARTDRHQIPVWVRAIFRQLGARIFAWALALSYSNPVPRHRQFHIVIQQVAGAGVGAAWLSRRADVDDKA